ncbi:MAG: GNAT family N-acetyltransferase [Actinomycetales bacterium]|nr:GNAT family N-acetyltransferase [Actinomycetales bacterium]
MAHDDGAPRRYPAHWEADVVLRDGVPAHLRPIAPSDADALQAFHVGQSERSVYLRFFAPMERLSPADLERFTHVDHRDRVALVVVAPGEGTVERIIAVGRFDRVGTSSAEVAFTVADAHQRRGLGSILLEHLAAAGRELGIAEFTAEVLPQNGAMLAVFREAGFEVRQAYDDGLVAVRIDLDPSARSRDVMADREHRAEARSMQSLWDADSVLVVGPGSQVPGLDAARAHAVLVAQLAQAAPSPRVAALGVHVPEELSGHPRLVVAPTIDDVPGPVQLAAVALPAAEVLAVVPSLARLGVRAVVVLSTGFAEDGPEGLALQRELLRTAHSAGIRVIGPGSFGIARPGGGLNLSLAARVPDPGGVGLFCQSAAVAVRLVDDAVARGIGTSQVLSSGNRADVSGNDVMQSWADDPGTRVAALSLESIGNPRKFVRVARRLARLKPVVVTTAGRSGQVVPPGHAVRVTAAPRRTLEEMLRQSGVLRVESTAQLLDVAQLFAHQPVPAGRRVGVVASSHSLAALVAENAAAAGLVLAREAVVLPEDAPRGEVRRTFAEACAWPDVDALVVAHVSTVGPGDPSGVAGELALAAARSKHTVVAYVHGLLGVRAELTALDPTGAPRTVPAFRTPTDAVGALGHAARYRAWLEQDEGEWARPAGTDPARAVRLVDSVLSSSPEGRALTAEETAELLGAVGLEVAESAPPDGVACVVRSGEDRLFGPVVSFGLAGDASELLGDLAQGIAPLTTADVAHLVRSVRAAPRLFGYRGRPAVDVTSLEDLVARVAVLSDALPELAALELEVTVGESGAVVVGARARVSDTERRDRPVRTLPT